MDKHITIEKASEKWRRSKKTIMTYIAEGVISNLKVDNNVVLVPDIKRPHYIGKRKKINHAMEIIRATERDEYIDYLLLSIPEDEYKAIISWLINEKYLIETKKTNKHTDNTGVKLSPNLKNKNINISIKPDFSVKMNNQIGLVNAGVNL